MTLKVKMEEIKSTNIERLVKSLAEQKTDKYTSFTAKQIVAYGKIGDSPVDFTAWRRWEAGGYDQIQSRLHLFRPAIGLLKEKVVRTDGFEMHSKFNMFTMEVYHQFVRASGQDKWYREHFELGMDGYSYFADVHDQSKDKEGDHKRILASLDANTKFNLHWIPDEPILIDFLQNIRGPGITLHSEKLGLVYSVLSAYSSVALNIMKKYANAK